MTEYTVTLPVDKFKAILLHSWELLPQEQQQILIQIGLYPNKENETYEGISKRNKSSLNEENEQHKNSF